MSLIIYEEHVYPVEVTFSKQLVFSASLSRDIVFSTSALCPAQNFLKELQHGQAVA